MSTSQGSTTQQTWHLPCPDHFIRLQLYVSMRLQNRSVGDTPHRVISDAMQQPEVPEATFRSVLRHALTEAFGAVGALEVPCTLLHYDAPASAAVIKVPAAYVCPWLALVQTLGNYVVHKQGNSTCLGSMSDTGGG